MTTKYALKHEENHGIHNIRYIDIFTKKQIGIIINMQANSDLSYEIENEIICNGDYVTCICDDIAHLLSARNDGLEFTDVNILLNMDMVTVCNIDFSTRYTPSEDIRKFIQLLISTTDEQGENILHLTFSRPDFDDTTFILNKSY